MQKRWGQESIVILTDELCSRLESCHTDYGNRNLHQTPGWSITCTYYTNARTRDVIKGNTGTTEQWIICCPLKSFCEKKRLDSFYVSKNCQMNDTLGHQACMLHIAKWKKMKKSISTHSTLSLMVFIMISIMHQADGRSEIEVTFDAYVSISSFSCMKCSTTWEVKQWIIFIFPKSIFYVRNCLWYNCSKRAA